MNKTARSHAPALFSPVIQMQGTSTAAAIAMSLERRSPMISALSFSKHGIFSAAA